MSKACFILYFSLSILYAQDTVFFKVEPTKPFIVSKVVMDEDFAYLTNLSGDKESKVEKSSIFRIGYYSKTNYFPEITDSNRTEEYCIVVGAGQMFSTKVKITIDFGEATDFWKPRDYIRDETGEVIKFNSMVDALNYMNGLGWEFVAAYPASSNQGSCYHFVMKRKLNKK